MRDRITINGITYFVGEKYVVYSPLDSPYLFMENDVRIKRHKNSMNDRTYIGTLVQVPEVRANGCLGACLYFCVNDIRYHREHYHQAESMKQIKEGIVKIRRA